MAFLDRLAHFARRQLNRKGFESRSFESSRGQLHFYDGQGKGELPPIVLLHGFGADSTTYGFLMRSLKPHTRRIIVPDAIGHGFSDIPEDPSTMDADTFFEGVRELLDQELQEPAIIFGNSLGGASALRYVQSSPDKVKGLVLCSPAGAHFNNDHIEELRMLFSMKNRREAVQFLKRLYARMPWYVRFIAGALRQRFQQPHIRALLNSITEIARNNEGFSPEDLAQLMMPMMLIWGQDEKILPSANRDYFRTHLPEHAIIHEPSGYGHSPFLEKPSPVAGDILSFARKL